jgi:26S proteasome regulatory subunit N11
VAVVIDPIQSVRGRVVIDAFRSINPQLVMMGQEPRQTTSVVGLLNKPSIQALIHGLGRHYYSLCVGYLRSGSARGDERETKMLARLGRERWSAGLVPTPFGEHATSTAEAAQRLVELSKAYAEAVREEGAARSQGEMDAVKLKMVGRVDAKRRAEEAAEGLMEDNVVQSLTAMLGVKLF